MIIQVRSLFQAVAEMVGGKNVHSKGFGEQCAEQLQILANAKRQEILHLLSSVSSPLTVTEIQMRLKEEQSLVSHHLQTLRKAGFIRAEKTGRYCRYAVSNRISNKLGRQTIHLGCCSIVLEK